MRQVPSPHARPDIKAYVAQQHGLSQGQPIVSADAAGCFPPAHLWSVFPIVVDANWIRGELVREARCDTRTILANAVNSGVLRLFCTKHVVEEVEEHLARWATEISVDPAAMREIWQGTYLPLVRCVDPIPEDLTSTEESERLALLAGRDSDDVPTATLALLLGAPLVGGDKNALRAVYGENFDHRQHEKGLLQRLRSGGDLGPLEELVQGAHLMMNLTGTGVYQAMRWLARQMPWWVLTGAAVSALALLHKRTSAESRARAARLFGAALNTALELYGEISSKIAEAEKQFATISPPQPQQGEIATERGSSTALARACLYTLARSPEGQLSARQLSKEIGFQPDFPYGEAKVRSILRSLDCVAEPYAGRFQVGNAL